MQECTTLFPHLAMLFALFAAGMIFIVAALNSRRAHALAVKEEENRHNEALAMIEKSIVPPAPVTNYY